MLQYFVISITSLLAVVGLVKDWKAHKANWQRGSVIALLVAGWVIGIWNVHSTRKANDSDKGVLNQKISGLNGAVDAASKAADLASKTSIAQIGHLSDRVADLQTEVKTADLQHKVNKLELDLAANEKVMAPAPKAKLQFDLGPSDSFVFGQVRPSTDVDRVGQHITIPFRILNYSDSDALDGFVNIDICDACTFATEPAGWTHLSGTPETQRDFQFSQILKQSTSPGQIVDIYVPQNAGRLEVGFAYRCKTCEAEPLKREHVYIRQAAGVKTPSLRGLLH